MNTIRLNVLGEAKAASSGVSIKNQDKSVEITENGVTELTADSGYTGLGKVTINANVQGGGSDESNAEYWDTSELNSVWTFFAPLATSVKGYSELLGGNVTGIPPMTYEASEGDVLKIFAIEIELNKIIKTANMSVTIKEYLISMGLTESEINSIPRITKEQYYTL